MFHKENTQKHKYEVKYISSNDITKEGFYQNLSKKAPMSLASEMNLTYCSLLCSIERVGNLSLPTGRRNVKRVEIL